MGSSFPKGGSVELRYGTVLVRFNGADTIDNPSDIIFIDDENELCRIGGVLRNLHDLRRPGVVKGVGVLSICCLSGGFSGVDRSLSVCESLGVEDISVTVLPGYGIAVDGGFELGRVESIACYRYDLGGPSAECVGVLCI